MTFDVQVLDKTARIKIDDRFDSSVYAEFKKAYMPLIVNVAVKIVEIDISTLNYMDSAALGMLLQLDAAAANAGKSISLIGVPGRVADILKTAHADKLFTINLPSGIKLNLRS